MELLELGSLSVDDVQQHVLNRVELAFSESVGVFEPGLPHLESQGHLAGGVAFLAPRPLPIILGVEHIRHHRIFQKTQRTAYSGRREIMFL